MFKNILPIPENQDTCPVDVFVALTADKQVDYVRLRTDCLNAKVGGYLYTGNFVHDIYITGKSLPNTPEDVPADTEFAVFSYLGDEEIQLNEFYSIQQPISGNAALVCTFGRNAGTKSVTVTQAHLSILGTTFATSLSVTGDGITFSSNSAVPLFGGFQAVISGTIPLGTSWDDFAIQLDGRFTDNPGSFVANVQDHVYDFTDSILESSAERIEASKMAETDAVFAQAHIESILAGKQNELNNLLSSKNEAMNRYTGAMNSYETAMDAYNIAMDSASDEALESVSLLKNICMAANVDWNQDGLPATYCKILSLEQEILEWGLKKKMHTESRLIHSVREVTKLKWGIEKYCQLVTLIRGWGNTMTAHRCSFIHTYDNITEEMLDAYHADVEIIKTEAAVTEMGSFDYCQKECDVTPWADSIPEVAQQYTSAACDVSRLPILESITNNEEDVVQAFLAVEEAKRQLSAAEITMKASVIAYNVSRDEYAALQSCMQYTDPNLASNIQTIAQEEAALQALKVALMNTNIQDLFSVVSIQFTSDITADTNTLPIDITYTVLGNTRTLTTSIEFTATMELINRSIANALLLDVGSYLQGNRRKRQATVESTFNENQFQSRCGQLNGITLYLEMIYDSLQTSYDTYMEATANISQVVALADQLLTTTPSEYPSIDFQYLKDNYNYEIDIATLNTQLGTAVPVTNRTAALQSLKKALMGRMDGLQESYYRSWQNDLKKLHSMGLIDTVGHVRCHGVMDCLNLVHEVMKNLITDMPASDTKQEFLDTLPSTRMSLLKLALYNSTLTLESALATNVTGMNSLVWSVLEQHYWCTDIPTITTHPQAQLSVHIGDTLTVECEASSVLPVTYSFEKNGFLVATGLSTGLYAKTATRYDSGLYQCIASNAVGSVQSTLSNVIVYMAPEITLSPSDYETFEGDENGGFFACNATSYPEPMYEWEYSKDGSTWVIVDNSKRNELIVTKPSETHEGWYRCKVHTEGSGMVRSGSAYLSILRATFSQLSYSVSFQMNSTLYQEDDSSGGSDEEFTPPTETVTINYFRDQLNLTYTTVDDLHIDFSTDNKVIVVRVSMSVSMNYSATMPFDDQVDVAYMKKQDLMQGMTALQEHVKDGTFWFETEGTYYRGAHVSANLKDPIYSCPMNYVLAYSNFMCGELKSVT